MLDMQVNDVAPHLMRWAEPLKDLTVSPLSRDYPEPQLEVTAREDFEVTESLEASQDV
jgi:hypothetical protein